METSHTAAPPWQYYKLVQNIQGFPDKITEENVGDLVKDRGELVLLHFCLKKICRLFSWLS